MGENPPQFDRFEIIPTEPIPQETAPLAIDAKAMLERGQHADAELESRIAERFGDEFYGEAHDKIDIIAKEILRRLSALENKGVRVIEDLEKLSFKIPKTEITLRVIPKSKIGMRMMAFILGTIGSVPPGFLTVIAWLLWKRSNAIPDTNNNFATANV